MKKLILIAAFLISSFALHAGNKEYLTIRFAFKVNVIEYTYKGENIRLSGKSKDLTKSINDALNSLSEDGWNLSSSSGGDIYIFLFLEREKE